MRERITFRSVGGFRVPGSGDSLPVVNFFEFLNRCKIKWDRTVLNDNKTSILFVSAGDCLGEAFIMKALVETKTPEHILMLDPVKPDGALAHMRTSVPTVKSQHYFSTMGELTLFCNSENTVPALVLSLNHTIGMLSIHPMHLNRFKDTLWAFSQLTGMNPSLDFLLCYQNDREGYQIIDTPLRLYIQRKQEMIGLLEQMASSLQRQRQEASDRELALQLERLQMQEFNDFQLAQASQDMLDT